MKRTLIRLGLTALISSALFGCGGGSDGVSGANGPINITVNPATAGSTIGSNATTPSVAMQQAWQALTPQVTVTGVTIASPPVVTFTVTDAAGNALVNLGNTSKKSTAQVASLTNLNFTLAKLVPATATEPSKWVSYLVLRPSTVSESKGALGTASCTPDFKWCGNVPRTDNEGKLEELGNGSYRYTFYRDVTKAAELVATLVDTSAKMKADLGDVSYNGSLTHRLGIEISGPAPGTGSNTPDGSNSSVAAVPLAVPTNVVYNFRPDGQAVTDTRNIVDISSCSSCHNGKGLAHGPSDNNRKDPNYCVTCHTDQVRYGMVEATRSGGAFTGSTFIVDGRSIFNYPNMLHKLHMGSELKLQNYDMNGKMLNDVEWIQDPRNCSKCHNGDAKTDINQATKTDDGNNWKTKPSRLACASCHDDISFAALNKVPADMLAHSGGPAADDSSCASCHSVAAPGAAKPIDVVHRGLAPTPNNPVTLDGIANISYAIKSVTLNASRQAEITFKITKDGKDLQVGDFTVPQRVQDTKGVYSVFASFDKNYYSTFDKNSPQALLAPNYTEQLKTIYQPLPGFVGGPTFYVAYAVPQDGIDTPADFNVSSSVSLANLLVVGSPKAGTLVNDTGGYMKATLTGNLTGQPSVAASGTVIAGQVATGSAAIKCTVIAGTPVIAGTCVNPSSLTVPTTAKMVTGALIGNFIQVDFSASSKTAALTKKYMVDDPKQLTSATDISTVTKVPGLFIKTPLKKLVATGFSDRRVLVDTNKCESCHEQLGTAVDFHDGARNDPTACAICHNANQTSNGWSANASTFVHGIHAGTNPTSVALIKARSGISGCVSSADVLLDQTKTQTCYPDGEPGDGRGGAGATLGAGKRTIPFSWHRALLPTLPGNFNAAASTYPGVLKRCESCHLPDVVNFANSEALLPSLLWPTAGKGSYDQTKDLAKVFARDPATGALKYIQDKTVVADYGAGFSIVLPGSVVSNAYVTNTAGIPTQAAGTTLVESPISSACFACHDSQSARNHMTSNGGVIYGVRSASLVSGVLVNKEGCLTCHGKGKDKDVAQVHSK